MADLKEYTVAINGIEHTLQLSPEDAKRYGDAARVKRAPANKAASASNKGGSAAADKGAGNTPPAGSDQTPPA